MNHTVVIAGNACEEIHESAFEGTTSIASLRNYPTSRISKLCNRHGSLEKQGEAQQYVANMPVMPEDDR
jgi:hypothetical protein